MKQNLIYSGIFKGPPNQVKAREILTVPPNKAVFPSPEIFTLQRDVSFTLSPSTQTTD